VGQFEQVRDSTSGADSATDSPLSSEALSLLGLKSPAAAISTDVAEKPSSGDDPYLRAVTPRKEWTPPTTVIVPGTERLTPVNPGVFAPQPAPPDVCKPSTAYEQLIEKAARNLYDPSPLSRIPDLKSKYNCLIKTDQDALFYANEILKSTGDPYNSVLMPTEARAVDRDRSGKHGDIGATFKPNLGNLVVDTVTPGGGADLGGLKKGDTIAYVNGENVSRASERELRNKITGADGANLSIKVIRDGKLLELKVAKTEKEPVGVRDVMLPNNVLYLKIESMDSERQPEQLKAAIERHPDAKSYILDLRDNPGGLFFNSLRMASLFMDKGNLLTVSRRADSDPAKPEFTNKHYVLTPDAINVTTSTDPKARPESQMARFQRITDKPVAILVNERTASAAEILAVSLKENNAATLVGGTTFGKGVGQTIFSGMPGGGAVKLTTFRFLSPKGNWFGDGINNRHGIASDIKISNLPGTVPGAAGDRQLTAAREFLSKPR
jgi:C-terminal peptidase prc